ncbi:MarR family transcriptional regulator [Saccharomonospora sp. CUA-673]|uniref:MarR family winged helix-turn-helix transcriptional regulator n=1 Tax=Saccharomonospora sp. CUA-673 TaxID=1904969 RepID=UPI0009602B79|nr:MarR family winged helix-turn-helix transcriptional regulator [Saccharomonospora sp. CUA-673]OLT43179.1 MarR family transcriptional regulator [Saccharomonospora sp. CUA-673]
MGRPAHTDETTTADTPAPPAELLAAPGYGARRLYQAYLAAWNRHVDPVLTGPQFAVLSTIRAHPNSDQSSLAGAAALDTSTMADLCRRLERRGLIQRVESPHDARRKLVSLTPDGKKELTRIHRKTRKLDEALLSGTGLEGNTDVAALLTALAERWESVAEFDRLP